MRNAVIQRALEEKRSVLTEIESKQLIAEAGIPTLQARLAGTKAQAIAFSKEIGFPVVLKIISPDVIHKSDAGGVKLGLANATQVGAAYSEVLAAAKREDSRTAIHGVSVQRMARPGTEVIVGVSRDAQFGPVLMFGLGGVFVEILEDVAFGIVPLLPRDASRMVREIKGSSLLRGYRGRSAADLGALEALLLKLSELVDRTPEIKEVDLNPIFAYRDGAVAVDARVVLEADARASRLDDAEGSLRRVPRFGERFPPESIAIVGVSQKSAMNAPGFTGMKYLRTLRDAGFEGRLYPVNPKAGEIDGLAVYPSLTELPETPDLVIVATRADAVPSVLEDCVSARAANVHVCSSGFSETGEPEGRILEDEIRGIAERGALRVIGPNCMGFHVPSARLKMFEEVELLDGPVAFVSQSGGHAMSFLMHGPDFGFGFSKVISYGNALTLDAPDFLEYLSGDPDTRVICMYLEGIREGRRLFDLVRRTNPVKPVVIWKSGLTESGARAAASHTGSLAGERQVWDAFFAQTGSIRVGSAQEMAEVAMTLLHPNRLLGRRAVVLSGGGGNNVATGDICAEEGLELPPLSPQTNEALREFLSSVNQGLTNPMDVAGALFNPALLRRTLGVLLADELIDVIVLHMVAGLFSERYAGSVSEFLEGISETIRKGPALKPIVVALDDSYRFDGTDECIREFREAGVLAYGSIRSAARALRRVSEYRDFLSMVAGPAGPDPPA